MFLLFIHPIDKTMVLVLTCISSVTKWWTIFAYAYHLVFFFVWSTWIISGVFLYCCGLFVMWPFATIYPSSLSFKPSFLCSLTYKSSNVCVVRSTSFVFPLVSLTSFFVIVVKTYSLYRALSRLNSYLVKPRYSLQPTKHWNGPGDIISVCDVLTT